MSLLFSACSRDEPPASEPVATGQEVAAPDGSGPATISNRVWVVSGSSSVAAGTMYTFLADGTLLITSPWSTPALGQWRQNGEELVMVEEGLEYRVEVLGLTNREFRVRIRNPGTPVEITFVPAEGVVPPG